MASGISVKFGLSTFHQRETHGISVKFGLWTFPKLLKRKSFDFIIDL